MARVEVTMPKMGESITEGTIISWHKKPGDRIDVDETLLEIGTDKVDTEVPSPVGGIVASILVAEGETVDVGTPVALIETDVTASIEAPPAAAPPVARAEPVPVVKTEPLPAPVSTAQEPAPAPARSAAPAGATVDVLMPKMGESIVEGTIITWHKKPGDTVEVDETLLEIATDKVDTEVPSPAAGVVAEILVPEGDTVEVGTRIAVIALDKEAAIAQSQARPRTPEAAPTVPTGDGAGVTPAAPPAEPIDRLDEEGRFFSPLVRSIAEKEGLSMQELSSIPGSGREGRLTKHDLLSYLRDRVAPPAPSKPAPAPTTAPAPRPAPTPSYEGRTEIIEMDRVRQIIAEHMVRSKATSAHVTSMAEADVTNLVRLRDRNKENFQRREGVPLTFTPFFVHAVIKALREFPMLNASVEGNRIIIKKDYHIGIAVALGTAGLIAPVIRSAGEKSLAGLARAVADLAQRARSKQLQPDELQGGTFTVTNVGSLGSIMGTPIINQPQVAILATGAIKKRPVVVEDPRLGDLIAIRHMMYLSLSYDHRIIDGALGSAFLHAVVQVLESFDPEADL